MSNENTEPINVAIAEDHPKMRSFISSILQQYGFNVVIEAKDGHTLIQELNSIENLPDVCLLDINMPRMKGYEVAGHIRDKYPDIKLAALTANTDMDSLIKMVKNGATSYLSKDSDPKEWKEAIHALVKRGHFVSEWMATTLFQYICKQ